MFTRASVDCADRIVATSSSSGLRCWSAHIASGYACSRRVMICFSRARSRAGVSSRRWRSDPRLVRAVGLTARLAMSRERNAVLGAVPAARPTGILEIDERLQLQRPRAQGLADSARGSRAAAPRVRGDRAHPAGDHPGRRRCGSSVLTNLNVDLEEIHQNIEAIVKKGKAAAAAGPDLPYTSRAKKVLEFAMSEARELNHAYVGTEHLLLGVLREEKGIGAQVLTAAGVTLQQARAETMRL